MCYYTNTRQQPGNKVGRSWCKESHEFYCFQVLLSGQEKCMVLMYLFIGSKLCDLAQVNVTWTLPEGTWWDLEGPRVMGHALLVPAYNKI